MYMSMHEAEHTCIYFKLNLIDVLLNMVTNLELFSERTSSIWRIVKLSDRSRVFFFLRNPFMKCVSLEKRRNKEARRGAYILPQKILSVCSTTASPNIIHIFLNKKNLQYCDYVKFRTHLVKIRVFCYFNDLHN